MDGNAANFVGNMPDHYDRGLGPVIFADYAADMARRVGARPVSRVLETAAGTGIVTRQLRDVLPANAQLTATDLNPPMVEVARRKFQSSEKVDLRSADAMALPFPAAAFDAVVCQFGVMFFPDKAKSYQEVYRVLAPAGRYLFNVWDSHRYNPFGRIAHEVAGSFFPADPPQCRIPFSYHQIDPIKECLLDIGFSDIQIAVVNLEKKIPDVELFARGLVYGTPLIDQIRERGGVDADRVVDAIAEAHRREFGADGRMPLQAIVFCTTRPQIARS
jgi:SAM-dependent methyltransferase